MSTLDVHRLPCSLKEIAAKPASWFQMTSWKRSDFCTPESDAANSRSFLLSLFGWWTFSVWSATRCHVYRASAPPVAPAFSLDRLSTTRKLTAFWEREIIRRCTHTLTSHTAIHNARSGNNMALKCVNCMRACVRVWVRTGRTHLLLRSSLLQVSLVVAGR